MAERLILTGFMGSGKTVVGRRLAGVLGWRFIDSDQELEERAGRSISQIFSADGEKGFRRMEEEVVLDLMTREPREGLVLSLGGGAVTTPAIRARLRVEPLVILLDADVETAYARAAGGARPLARSREDFERLYEQRRQLYRRVAKIVADTRGLSVEQVADMILREIGEGEDAS